MKNDFDRRTRPRFSRASTDWGTCTSSPFDDSCLRGLNHSRMRHHSSRSDARSNGRRLRAGRFNHSLLLIVVQLDLLIRCIAVHSKEALPQLLAYQLSAFSEEEIEVILPNSGMLQID